MFLLKNTLDGLGIETAASNAMAAAVKRWGVMYAEPHGLRLPAAIASETARLVTLELKSEISGSRRADYLNEQYGEALRGIRKATEYACAFGGVILKPYVNGGKISTDIVKANGFVPTRFDVTGAITGAAFMDRKYRGKYIYTRIEHHECGKSSYEIKNYAFRSESAGDLGKRVPLAEVDDWREITPTVTLTGVGAPLFAYFKIPTANTVDPDSPLGAAVYSRTESLIADADKQYERLLWEFESGERALCVDETAFRIDESGKRELPDKRLFVTMNQEGLFKEWSPSLREQSIISGLNEILRKIEFNAGLAYGTLSDVQETDKTAEEIKASKQRSYAQISDIQMSLKDALTALAGAMNTLADLYALAPEGDYDISFEFDDSIVADRKAEFNEKLQLVSAGVMSKAEFRMWYFGEDETTAADKITQFGDGAALEE